MWYDVYIDMYVDIDTFVYDVHKQKMENSIDKILRIECIFCCCYSVVDFNFTGIRNFCPYLAGGWIIAIDVIWAIDKFAIDKIFDR